MYRFEVVISTLPMLAVLCAVPDAKALPDFPEWRGDGISFEAFQPPDSDFVVSDQAPLLDSEIHGYEGPVVVALPIRRYVAPTDADGYLLSPDELVERGLLSATATLRVLAYDVDIATATNQGYGDRTQRAGDRGWDVAGDCDGDRIVDELWPENDRVLLNGALIGTLNGYDSAWQVNEFEIPISELKFPAAPGQTAENTITIEVDTLNAGVLLSDGGVGCNWWYVKIDWIALQFAATAPVVVVHGIRSNAASMAGLAAGLESEGLITESVNLSELPLPATLTADWATCSTKEPYNNSVVESVRQLREQITSIAESYGSRTVRIVGHSKGGLDGRAFIASLFVEPLPVAIGEMDGQPVSASLSVDSLVTLNTPHRGSLLADLGVAQRRVLWGNTNPAPEFGALLAFAAGKFEGSYYCDLTAQRAWDRVQASHIYSTQAASIATNADGDADFALDVAEAAGFPGGTSAANIMYNLVGRLQSVEVQVDPVFNAPDLVTIRTTLNTTTEPNDAVVPVASAALYPLLEGIGAWHHMSVASPQNGAAIALDAQDPLTGVLDWTVR
ncbi:MAG: hypothetical protein KJO54_04145 [Gammaproteobacteria bacterium]|nr:hypothetical protein [Gammaproteobacteria bacterium]NNF62291.1 hypothetical protein [Gammaproteobacteria bacterium]NNM21244.1 hypothetical protein [Gammaproteobacteria bacterium]